jgi:hypothetical protein
MGHVENSSISIFWLLWALPPIMPDIALIDWMCFSVSGSCSLVGSSQRWKARAGLVEVHRCSARYRIERVILSWVYGASSVCGTREYSSRGLVRRSCLPKMSYNAVPGYGPRHPMNTSSAGDMDQLFDSILPLRTPLRLSCRRLCRPRCLAQVHEKRFESCWLSFMIEASIACTFSSSPRRYLEGVRIDSYGCTREYGSPLQGRSIVRDGEAAVAEALSLRPNPTFPAHSVQVSDSIERVCVVNGGVSGYGPSPLKGGGVAVTQPGVIGSVCIWT